MTSGAETIERPDSIHSKDRFALASVCLAFLIADTAFAAMPVLFSSYVADRHYSLTTAGMIGSAETLGLAVGSAFCVRLLARPTANLRTFVLFGLAALLLAQLASAGLRLPVAFAVARGLSGACVGVVQSAGSAWIAQFSNSERPFAIYVGMSFLAGALGMPFFTFWNQRVGLDGGYLAFSVLIILAMCGAIAYPRQRRLQSSPRNVPAIASPRSRLSHQAFLLLSLAINFAVNGGVWVYLAQSGQRALLDAGTTSLILGAGMFLALVTTICAALAGNRFGRAAPLVAGHLFLIAGTLTQITAASPTAFMLAVALFHIGIATVPPYYLGALASADASGKAALRGIVAMNVGYSAGPWVLSVLVTNTGFVTAMVISALAFALSAVLVISARVDTE